MPDDDWAISNGTVEFRQEERLWALGRFECGRDDIDESAGIRDLQLPACDRCSQGVMDATNSHYLGLCECECHDDREEQKG